MWGAWWEPSATTTTWEASENKFTARIHATMRRLAPGTVLDGIAAAHLWGLPTLGHHQQIDVITNVAHSRHQSRWGCGDDRITVKPSSRTIPEEAVVEFKGIRVLKIEYLCAELLARQPRAIAVPIVEAALNKGLKPHPLQREYAEEKFAAAKELLQQILEKRRWRRGVRRALTLLAELSPWSQSVGESRMRMLMRDLRLPAPRQQYPVLTDRGWVWPDFSWPEKGVIVEFDGIDKYREKGWQTLREEKQREEGLREKFPRILRFLWQDLENGVARYKLQQLLPLLKPPG